MLKGGRNKKENKFIFKQRLTLDEKLSEKSKLKKLIQDKTALNSYLYDFKIKELIKKYKTKRESYSKNSKKQLESLEIKNYNEVYFLPRIDIIDINGKVYIVNLNNTDKDLNDFSDIITSIVEMFNMFLSINTQDDKVLIFKQLINFDKMPCKKILLELFFNKHS